MERALLSSLWTCHRLFLCYSRSCTESSRGGAASWRCPLAICSLFCHRRLMMVPLPSKETKPRVSSPPAHLSTYSIVAPCEALCIRYLVVRCTGALLGELWAGVQEKRLLLDDNGVSEARQALCRSRSGTEPPPSQEDGKVRHRVTPKPWLQALTHAPTGLGS